MKEIQQISGLWDVDNVSKTNLAFIDMIKDNMKDKWSHQ